MASDLQSFTLSDKKIPRAYGLNIGRRRSGYVLCSHGGQFATSLDNLVHKFITLLFRLIIVSDGDINS